MDPNKSCATSSLNTKTNLFKTSLRQLQHLPLRKESDQTIMTLKDICLRLKSTLKDQEGAGLTNIAHNLAGSLLQTKNTQCVPSV